MEKLIRSINIKVIVVAALIFISAISVHSKIGETLQTLDPKQETLISFLTIADYLAKVAIVAGLVVSITVSLSPFFLGFYYIVENRLIPGSLDDYLAEKWAPLKKYIPKEKLISFIKWTGTVAAIFGGTMLASKTILTPYGFIFLAVSSSLWLVTGFLTKDRPLITLNLFLFVMVDVHGIYRWLMS